jgi:hypothetical protein
LVRLSLWFDIWPHLSYYNDMKINIEWTETSYYCEEVEAPDNLEGEELDKWVNDIYHDEVYPFSIPRIETTPIEWHKA